MPAYQPISQLRVDGPSGEPGGACGSAAQRADHAAHVAAAIGRPAEGPEVVGQMLGRENLVCGLQRGAEIRDQRVDVEEWAAALAFRALSAGDGRDMSAPALAEDVESRGTVGVHLRPGGDMGVAERFRLCVAEAADYFHGNSAHAATWVALAGGDDAGLPGGTTALVALIAEIDIVRFPPKADFSVANFKINRLRKKSARFARRCNARRKRIELSGSESHSCPSCAFLNQSFARSPRSPARALFPQPVNVPKRRLEI